MNNTLYRGILAIMVFLLTVAGCSKSSSPTSPAVPAMKPLTITVTASTGTGTSGWGPPVLLLVGTTETLKATATASDGTMTLVTDGRWSSDNPRIATVESATGRVTIVGPGIVNISVEYLVSRLINSFPKSSAGTGHFQGEVKLPPRRFVSLR